MCRGARSSIASTRASAPQPLSDHACPPSCEGHGGALHQLRPAFRRDERTRPGAMRHRPVVESQHDPGSSRARFDDQVVLEQPIAAVEDGVNAGIEIVDHRARVGRDVAMSRGRIREVQVVVRPGSCSSGSTAASGRAPSNVIRTGVRAPLSGAMAIEAPEMTAVP